MVSYETFLSNIDILRARVAEACAVCGRDPAEVKVLPVTKTHPVEAVEFAKRAGFLSVGENRVQEGVDKIGSGFVDIQWELIGHLQSNKAALAVKHFDRVQSVESAKLIGKLDKACEEVGKVLPVLLQVNTGEDPAKFGVMVEEAPQLLEKALSAKHLQVQGLMTIAPLSGDMAVASRAFEGLRGLRDQLEKQFSVKLPELSMGMSGDMAEAIRAGSTMIRVGSALFGPRG